MAFITKLDYSNNRQIKQREKTSTTLSGATVFGVDYSGLTFGPNLDEVTVTETVSSITGSTYDFTNNNLNINWVDSRLNISTESVKLTLLNNVTVSGGPTTSVGPFYVGDTFTVVDGNTVYNSYSGVSFDYTVENKSTQGTGSTDFNGDVSVNNVVFYSATSVDFSGRTVWVDNKGITRTKDLIVSNNAQPGYILSCKNVEGFAEWVPSQNVSRLTSWERISGILQPEAGGTVRVDGLILPSYSPTITSSSDTRGVVGEVAYDNSFLYVKTVNGWRRINLTGF